MSAARRGLPLAILLLAVGGVALLVSRSCGCAPPGEAPTPLVRGAAALPEGFAIAEPWEAGKRHRIIRAYGQRSHVGVARPLRANDYYALDFDLDEGEPVLSVAPGTVAYAGPASGGWSSYGTIVFVRHPGGVGALYAHLSHADVRTGDRVAARARLGVAGSSGGGSAHLHLALYRGARLAEGDGGTGPFGGRSVLPEPFGRERRVGLATGQCIAAE